jgi:hypothetical protein
MDPKLDRARDLIHEAPPPRRLLLVPFFRTRTTYNALHTITFTDIPTPSIFERATPQTPPPHEGRGAKGSLCGGAPAGI